MAQKKLLDERGLEYTDINIFNNEAMRGKLEAETHHHSVPFIFIGDVCIGGYKELKNLDSGGELKELLK